MGNRLEGRVAVVTGAGRGIGRGEALALAAEGARVVVNDPGVERDGTGADLSPANAVVAEIRAGGGEAVANCDSVASWKGAEAIVRTALDTFGRLDILVNNAGILRDRMIFNMSEEEWDAVLRVHLYGSFFTIRHAAPHFRRQRSGRIINTSSSSGLGMIGQSNYGAAKEGVVGLTRCVARDMGKYGVTCNAIRPRGATRMVLDPKVLAAAKKTLKENPQAVSVGDAAEMIRRLEEDVPEGIAPFVTYLALDEAAGINGYTFHVTRKFISVYPEPAGEKTIYNRGNWSLEELIDIVPSTLAKDLKNPAPPKPATE